MPIYYSEDIERVEEVRQRIFNAIRIVEAQLPQLRRRASAIPAQLAREVPVANARFKHNLRTVAALVQAAERSMKQ